MNESIGRLLGGTNSIVDNSFTSESMHEFKESENCCSIQAQIASIQRKRMHKECDSIVMGVFSAILNMCNIPNGFKNCGIDLEKDYFGSCS